jgi:hypothetical protein
MSQFPNYMCNEFELNWKKKPFYGVYTTNSTFTLILKADKFCTKIILFYPNFHILSGLNIKNNILYVHLNIESL